MANTFGNEFFVLVLPDYSATLENAAMPSSVFTPDTTESAQTITNATNANPIVITTSGTHGLLTGRAVTIVGIGGNTAANGKWFITKLTTTTFSIPTSGNGAYTSGGTEYPDNSSVDGESILLGEAIAERDILAINSGVVPQPSTPVNVVWVY